MKNTFIEDMARFIGILILSLIGLVVLTGLIYVVVGEFSDDSRRWLAVFLVYTTLGALLLGIGIGRAYRAGYEAHATGVLPRGATIEQTPAGSPGSLPLADRLPPTPRVFGVDESAALIKFLEDLDA